jgi:hypothetical protein
MTGYSAGEAVGCNIRMLKSGAQDPKYYEQLSHDVNTMEGHFRDFIRQQNSPGLILIPQKRIGIGGAIESLLLLWEVLDAADLENRSAWFQAS